MCYVLMMWVCLESANTPQIPLFHGEHHDSQLDVMACPILTHTHKSRSVQLQVALFNCVSMYINVHPTIQPIVTVVGKALSNIEAHDIALAVETFQVVVGGRCLPCDDVGCDWLNQDEEIIKSLWNNNP